MIRVAIVAASALLRAGLETLISTSPAVAIVGAVDASQLRDDTTLAELVAPLAPSVAVWVLDDVEDDDADWLAPLRDESDAGAPSIVVLADVHGADALTAALRVGVRAVLPRDASADEIIAAIEAAAAGLVALPSDLVDDLLAASARAEPALTTATSIAPSDGAPLSAREREVLALIARGMANKAIAPRLGISEHTVKAHVASIFEKLGAGTRAEAVVTAARLGLLLL